MFYPSIAHAANTAYAEEEVELGVLKVQAQNTEQLLHKLTEDLSIADKIRLSARKYKVNESLALNIACAESQFNAKARNPLSTAGGVYQFLDGTWASQGKRLWGTLEGRNKLNADDNIELAMSMISKTGTSDWNASKNDGTGGGWSQKPYERGLCK